MMRRYLPGLLLATLLVLSPATSAGTITTPGILAKTSAAALSCMQWMPVGLCFWLDCGFFGCDVEASLKVGHYNPDLVVSAYNEPGGNPWLEIRATLGLAQATAASGLLGALSPVAPGSAGNRTEGTAGRDHKNLVFRETDAIGHPAGALSTLVAGFGLICRSQATPLLPYFQSGLDALAWRLEVPELFYPASFIPGLREIGSWPLQTWGSVHPRTGWTTQADEPKAAAVTAQRAGDIVTRLSQPHVYVPLAGNPSGGSQRVWPPGALIERNHRTGTWQMLSPRTDTACGVFGTNDLAHIAGYGGGRVDAGGDYVWNLWRPYRCCNRAGEFFLFDIDFITFPP